MIWPPVKAWTRKYPIKGKKHFVAINYGGNTSNRWVVLVSVIDARIAIKVPWSQLENKCKWIQGWEENNYNNSSVSDNKQIKVINCNSINPSIDSGLTVPITKGMIRPWFEYP